MEGRSTKRLILIQNTIYKLRLHLTHENGTGSWARHATELCRLTVERTLHVAKRPYTICWWPYRSIKFNGTAKQCKRGYSLRTAPQHALPYVPMLMVTQRRMHSPLDLF